MAKSGENTARLQLIRKHPKKTAAAVAIALVAAYGLSTNAAEAPPAPPAAVAPGVNGAPVPEGVQPGVQGPGAPTAPPFDTVAGQHNKQNLQGRVRCSVNVVRGAGSVTIAGTVNQAVEGVWYSYMITSQAGTVKGWGQAPAIAIADPGNVAAGKANNLAVSAHYPYGKSTSAATCTLSGAGNLGAPAPDYIPAPADQHATELATGPTVIAPGDLMGQ